MIIIFKFVQNILQIDMEPYFKYIMLQQKIQKVLLKLDYRCSQIVTSLT
jgi:hypothetical protein